MRSGEKPATLNEMIGSGKNKVTRDNLHEILGLKMPEIPMTEVGKVRLINALHQRFGANFRQMPGVSDLLEDFYKDLDMHETLRKNKESRDASNNG